MRALLIAALMTTLAVNAAAEPARFSPAIQKNIARLKETAAKSDLGFEITRDLVREVGPRMAGTEAETRARAWAVAKFKTLGFTARIEPFKTNMWRRTHESARLTTPFSAPLTIATLGNSAPTPEGGFEAEVVRFPDLAALEAAKPESVEGKIVFLDEKMARSQDGSTYGAAVVKRRRCPILAREKKAAACLIRTVGTSPQRVANTGNITSRESRIIPAAALSNPDSDELAYLLSKGPVRVRLDIGVETQADAPSGNVIAEIRGREKPHEIVLLGAHLDSWDITPGAHDDGTGVGTMMASAKLIADLPGSPRRTIRIVLFGSEETGLIGSIGRFVLETAARDAVRWRRIMPAGQPLFVNVNVSARQLLDPTFLQFCDRLALDVAVKPAEIRLEITETLALDDSGGAATALQRLRRAGFGLVMDDFGAGHSTLSRLANLTFDAVKVDSSFLRGGAAARSVLAGLIRLARDLGLEATVEGVESEEDLAFLDANQCPYAQGYHCGRPRDAAETQRLVAEVAEPAETVE